MANRERVTMQGVGSPVSAAGQGEQAGPQASSSCDRSPILMVNLVNIGYNATRRNLFQNTEPGHICDRDLSVFCYICAKFEVPKNRRNITENIKALYKSCFGFEMADLQRSWVPNKVCGSCYSMLMRNNSGNKTACFSTPARWRRPDTEEDCYFCQNNVAGINLNKKSSYVYKSVNSLIEPVQRTVEIEDISSEPMEVDDPVEQSDYGDSESESSDTESSEYEDGNVNVKEDVTQEDLNDLVRDLGLPKDGSEFLASWLKKRKLVGPKVKVSYYRDRDKEFRKFFSYDADIPLVYCDDVKGLIDAIKPNCYKNDEWRLFIDSSCKSLKAVLLHNTNVYAPVPVAHSIVTQEEYGKLKILLEKIKYNNHNWQICGDLKIITILLGQQAGYTKYPCFMCEWDSRDGKNHYTQKEWPPRSSFKAGDKNVLADPLVNPEKVLLPPLHIKLGLIKQFVKALDKEGRCFNYIQAKFPNVSEAKLSEGIFDGPKIRTLMRDSNFSSCMTETERKAWLSFKNVVENFLGNQKAENYKDIVAEMIDNFGKLGCNMSIKMHFLYSHIDYFPDVLGHYSEEQGERFHQDIKEMEKRYQGRWDVNMMADFCWNLKREKPQQGEKRKRLPLHRSFENKRVRYHKKQ